MHSIGILILAWLAVAVGLGFAAFRFTPRPLDAKDEMVLLGAIGARSLFFAYLFAPYGVAAPFVGIIAPASLFLPAYILDTSPGAQGHINNCITSILVTAAIISSIYISRQIIKRRWP